MREKLGMYISGVTVVCIIAVMLIVHSGYYTVDQGERALVLRFGQVKKIADPGFHFKVPFIDSVRHVSVRSTKVRSDFAVYSKDVQGADVTVSVNYALSPGHVEDVYSRYGVGYESRIVHPQIITKSKDAFGRHNAVETIQSRDALARMILMELQGYFQESGFTFESVQIENIDFSDEYERSVEERMKAEVEVARVQQNLAREEINADMVRTRARGEADARLAEAEAQAKAIVLISDAETVAIRNKALALRDNPLYVNLVQAERWDGQLPTSIIPSGSLPILSLPSSPSPLSN